MCVPVRGGDWNNGTAAGVFAFNLNNRRSNSYHNIGVRAAFLSCQICPAYGLASAR